MKILTRDELDAIGAQYVDVTKPWSKQISKSVAEYNIAAIAESERLEALVVAAGKQPPKRPEYCHDDIQFADELESHLAVLRTMTSLSPKPISESASGSSVDRHSQLAARQPDATPKTTVKRLTATEEILKAKNVDSLAELEAKRATSVETKSDSTPKPDVKAQLMEVAGVKTLPELKKFTAKLREPNATERLLESQGVKTLAELAAKRAEERRAKSRGRTALLLLFLSLAFNVGAQDPKVYTLISGGTNAVPANSTNAAVVHRVDEYGDASLQASVAAPSGTSNLLFYVFRSVDTETYESSPFTTLIAPSSSTTNVAFTNFNVGAAASIKIVPANTNAGNYTTNVTLKIRFKASKRKLAS